MYSLPISLLHFTLRDVHPSIGLMRGTLPPGAQSHPHLWFQVTKSTIALEDNIITAPDFLRFIFSRKSTDKKILVCLLTVHSVSIRPFHSASQLLTTRKGASRGVCHLQTAVSALLVVAFTRVSQRLRAKRLQTFSKSSHVISQLAQIG
jgi:hypothetical protein